MPWGGAGAFRLILGASLDGVNGPWLKLTIGVASGLASEPLP
jgi:hypothetical protein